MCQYLKGDRLYSLIIQTQETPKRFSHRRAVQNPRHYSYSSVEAGVHADFSPSSTEQESIQEEQSRLSEASKPTHLSEIRSAGRPLDSSERTSDEISEGTHGDRDEMPANLARVEFARSETASTNYLDSVPKTHARMDSGFSDGVWNNTRVGISDKPEEQNAREIGEDANANLEASDVWEAKVTNIYASTDGDDQEPDDLPTNAAEHASSIGIYLTDAGTAGMQGDSDVHQEDANGMNRRIEEDKFYDIPDDQVIQLALSWLLGLILYPLEWLGYGYRLTGTSH